jgi:hypothetical protein
MRVTTGKRRKRCAVSFTKMEDRGYCAHCGQMTSLRGRFVGRQMVAFLNRLRAAEGGLVSREEMIEYLWGDDPEGGPDDARGVMTQYAFHLRRAGYPVRAVFGRGFQFVPRYKEVPPFEILKVAA